MREALTFDYKGKQVRTIEQDGETWWVLKDVCEVFGEKNYRRVSSRLDEDEKGVSQIGTPGGLQSMTIINEAGLYATLFAMQPEKARGVTKEYVQQRQEQLKSFRKWVTSEVLPSIRRTGNYISNPSQTETAIIELAGQVGRLTEMVIGLYAERQPAPQAQPERQSLPEQIMLIGTEGRELCGIMELLKRFHLGCSAQEFNKLLREQGYMERRAFPRLHRGEKGVREIDILTEKGLLYGENAYYPRSAKGGQPRYYADSFLVLYQRVTKE